MKEELYYVIAFDSTHHAIMGEKILREKGLDIRTIPTPREITASCGLSLKFNMDILDRINEFLSNIDFSIKGVYKVIRTSEGKTATKIQ